ncbi:tetratricopeptide repeat protein [Desulfolutivibrio sulfoxidireducens]|uniref:tetratricopeptide repeat protein n=1 Tax=Desulfolutivibrio sulfoxidireducens TaxID=2773299 RepID=UPI00159DEF29|nr:tetratricopeptide repeat protein [Desulfolutivibrio sulfoxidireducens]QLA17501.1 tetratricopeptide repeat protein [Desulfolutivibrio sulfoxidireducens]QLA21086.1 tetratricopeptide repeat protein [Desulfolutivibrio sulfoxidireducens]
MSGQLDYEINKELGECYLFMGDLDKSEEYYRKAMNGNGVHAEPHLGLATIAVQRGELDMAMGHYREAADLEGSDRSYAGMALIEMERGEIDAAFAHFGMALAKNPENVVALFGMVRLSYTENRIEDVLPYLKDYLAVDPMKNEVRFTLAGCLMSLGRHDEAREHLETILEQEPGNRNALELSEQLRRNAA